MSGAAHRLRALLKVVMDLATVAVGAVALVVLFSRVRSTGAPEAEGRPRYPRRVANWTDFSQDGARLGSVRAKVTVVEFGDFQCPFCARAAAYLRRLRERFPTEVAIVYRHYPVHPDAFTVAIAAECARAGGSFERFHDALFREPQLIGGAPWSTYAREAGIEDTLAFSNCLRGSQAAVAVAKDTAAARTLRVPGTPTFLVNDVFVPGFPGDEVMDSVVVSVLLRVSGSR